MYDLRFLQRVLSSGIYLRVVRWNTTDVPDEHVIFIVRIEEYAKEEIGMKQAGSRALLMIVSLFVYFST
jgi:hypothetical protein